MVASSVTLEKLTQGVFIPTTKSTSVSLITFYGSGIPSALAYITKKENNNFLVSSNTGVIWIHMATFAVNPGEALRDSIFTFKNDFGTLLNEEVEQIISVRTSSENSLSLPEFFQVLSIITEELDIRLTVIFHNLNHIGSSKQLSLMNGLFKLNHQKINYIFHSVSNPELFSEESLGLLHSFYMTNVVDGKDYLMNSDDILVIFDTVEADLKVKFSPNLKSNVLSLSAHDPFVAKYLIMESTRNKALEAALSNTSSVSFGDIYEFLNIPVLENRFNKIFSNLSAKDIENINKDTISDTSYLYKSGLFVDQNQHILPQNPILKHFLPLAVKFNPRSLFTGQQQIIYDYLNKYEGEIVSKEDIAQIMWGPDWESKFSSQAIDKQLSNIRKQLNSFNLKQEIITVRDQGYILKSQDLID